MTDDACGLYYVRTWMRGAQQPHEERFTRIADAEKAMNEHCADRAYVRVEFLICREWLTRDFTRNDN